MVSRSVETFLAGYDLGTMATKAEAPSVSPRVALLLQATDQGYDHKSWHGPVLRGTLRGVTAEQAAWRPAPGRHSIWELAVHAAYWKYSILRRLRKGERGGFPLPGSNWFPRPAELSEQAWKDDLRVLAEMHKELRQAIEGLSDTDLDSTPEGSKTRLDNLILGGAFHDIYHAGQIQLLKRLQGIGGGTVEG
ncbi:MAG TPA: DinB family protein [Thermoanaerobaculia bacterium]|nr:DinB family protein [Thermoanaerobaculia bacterium]